MVVVGVMVGVMVAMRSITDADVRAIAVAIINEQERRKWINENQAGPGQTIHTSADHTGTESNSDSSSSQDEAVAADVRATLARLGLSKRRAPGNANSSAKLPARGRRSTTR